MRYGYKVLLYQYFSNLWWTVLFIKIRQHFINFEKQTQVLGGKKLAPIISQSFLKKNFSWNMLKFPSHFLHFLSKPQNSTLKHITVNHFSIQNWFPSSRHGRITHAVHQVPLGISIDALHCSILFSSRSINALWSLPFTRYRPPRYFLRISAKRNYIHSESESDGGEVVAAMGSTSKLKTLIEIETAAAAAIECSVQQQWWWWWR